MALVPSFGFAPQPQEEQPQAQQPSQLADFLSTLQRWAGLTQAPGVLERLTGSPSMLHKMQALQAMQQADPQAMLHDPQARALGMDIASNFGFAGPIKAAHASPYLFDAVDLGKVGTGQGAQSYGHGFYASTAPEVHQQYLNEFKRSHGAANSYDLTIAHEPEDFLAWDKPLSEQSQGVREKLTAHINDLRARDPEAVSVKLFDKGKANGAAFYSALAADVGLGHEGNIHPMASAALRDAGIPGIRYLDEGSRHLPDPLTAKDLTIRDQGGGTWLLTSTDPRRGALSAGKIEKQGGKFWAKVGQQDSMPFGTLDEAKAYAMDAAQKDTRTHNYVLFSHEPITIDARNGQPIGFAPSNRGTP